MPADDDRRARYTIAARAARGVLIALEGANEAPTGDELGQLRADAMIGRALREAVASDVGEEPLIHIHWSTPSGQPRGKYLGDPRLTFAREQLRQAALELLEELDEGIDPSPASTEERRP